MPLRHLLIITALFMVGCGHRLVAEFKDTKASARSDGRIEVRTELVCKPVGHIECGRLCVDARWQSKTAPGTVIDTVRACGARALKIDESEVITLVSNVPIPSSIHADIDLGVDSASGKYVQETGSTLLPSP